ncbi:MAG: YcxB family protein [Clostridia bacterium]|nr:YcxB family protein [Clostridia bacterium]
MIESKFEYTENLINKINASAIKKYNIIVEVAMIISLIALSILFITGNTLLGIVFSMILACLVISFVITNKSVSQNNKILIGQQVNIMFNETSMDMTTTLGEKVLYNANFEYDAIKKIVKSKDLVFIYFDKVSVVIFPKTSFKTSKDYEKVMQLVANNYIV